MSLNIKNLQEIIETINFLVMIETLTVMATIMRDGTNPQTDIATTRLNWPLG